ncbi:hypothetical protein [Flavobacterium sp. MK4S-17]|uniref:hypothetical protein n=1 Tax=Flavobacterium sp. MK4S-17 TaxID=2543737 RepID=UPI001357DF70|nr:hypothetical protein [Flavobacterium sp. MK4S-17]
MKNIFTTLALLAALTVSAQSGQDRVMLQQIAALKTYGSYIKKGYRIAKDGLAFIGSVKDGELSLHTLFFDGLKNVGSFVRQYPKAGAILELNNRIGELHEKLSAQLATDLFHGNEKDYIRRVVARVLEGCADDIDALNSLLSQSSLVMDDAQRLERIDALYDGMEDRYIFSRAYHNACVTLAAARQQECSGIRQSRELLNLNELP